MFLRQKLIITMTSNMKVILMVFLHIPEKEICEFTIILIKSYPKRNRIRILKYWAVHAGAVRRIVNGIPCVYFNS